MDNTDLLPTFSADIEKLFQDINEYAFTQFDKDFDDKNIAEYNDWRKYIPEEIMTDRALLTDREKRLLYILTSRHMESMQH